MKKNQLSMKGQIIQKIEQIVDYFRVILLISYIYEIKLLNIRKLPKKHAKKLEKMKEQP